MKIQITKEQPATKEPDVVPVHPDEIDIVEDGGCELIRLSQTLDYCPTPVRNELFEKVLKKVRYEGTVCISGLDIISFGLGIANGKYDIDEINLLLFSGGQSISDLGTTKAILLQKDFVIKKTRFDGDMYFIEAQRPGPSNE